MALHVHAAVVALVAVVGGVVEVTRIDRGLDLFLLAAAAASADEQLQTAPGQSAVPLVA